MPSNETLAALKIKIAQLTEKGLDLETAIPSFSVFRANEPTQTSSLVYVPSVCVVVQGEKHIVLGDDSFDYNSGRYLLTAIDLPTIVQITEASHEKPFLGMKLELDQRELSNLMIEHRLPAPKPHQTSRGMATGEMTGQLLEAFKRLLDLLDQPQDIPVMATLIQREIYYRLLTGEQGNRLRQMISSNSQSSQISQAIKWLRLNFSSPLRIEDLAAQASMSKSTFHQHFRELTAMSPLQYQKCLRLNEARRLMLLERMDASSAAFKVGYESPSQFSREYSRMFGAPPSRDIGGLRQSSADA